MPRASAQLVTTFPSAQGYDFLEKIMSCVKTTSSSAEETFMDLALQNARKALHPEAAEMREPEVPVGCVFVLAATGEVIATGYNQTNEEHNAMRHAEMVAIDDILIHKGLSIDIFKECDL
jgi:tRNA(Arg) A34 adenosine deaminase TadA